MRNIPTTTLPAGETIPVLGQGTWMMGERADRKREVDALRLGIELGMTLIDTAEMYGSGLSEELVGEAVGADRENCFIVSKVLPSNASAAGTVAACERSLRHLRMDVIDLYLLHWQGSHPLEATIEGFERLREQGKIRHWGVSNFDLADMQELVETPGGEACQVNQVLYNLTRRGIEYDLLEWSRGRGMPIMAYSPIEQGRLSRSRELQRIADDKGVTPAQVALAFVLSREGVIAIPKASTELHVRENRAAMDVELTTDDLAALDLAFSPPRRRQPLEMI